MASLPFWKFKDQREQWTLGLAVLAFLAALASVVFTGLQWSAAKRSADAADRSAILAKQTLDSASDSFQSEERAYIFVTGEALTAVKHPPFCDIPGLAPGRRICAEVQLVNGGKTPTVGVRIIRNVIVADEKTAPARIREFSVPPYKPEGSVMGPNGGTSKFDWATGVTEPMTDLELAELKAGKKNIFIFGVAQYLAARGGTTIS